ncbi:retrovirus-related pol polyprotein from transposon TNT 1-94 [Tanacetum coccineum]
MVVLTKRIAESFDWDEESVSLEDEWTTRIRAFMAIVKDEPSIGNADARSGNWVDVTMKKVHRLLSMTDGDEMKHVLDYTHVDLHYVEDHRKNLVNKFNLLKQELSLHKSKLCNLNNIVSINCSLQNEVIRVNLENESLKDEISDLKRVIKKWTCSKVTLDQLLSEQIPGNIVKALGGRGKRKEKISSKEVIFTKADESSSMSILEITSDSESECKNQKPLPPLLKLIRAAPAGTSDSLISLSDLTLNMANLTLNTSVPKKTRPTSVKVSPTYVIKRKTENKLPVNPKSCSDKKADSSTEQLLLTLMEEQKTWFGLCKHPVLRNHLSDDCYSKPKCSTCGSTDHLTKEHLEHAAVKKMLIKLKAQSPLNPTPKKPPMIPKPLKECKYYGFNDHHYENYEYYPGCEVCGSVAHEPADCPKKHPNSRKLRIANKRSTKPTKNGCSRRMTGVKQYLHKYLKESGPKVVFRDDSSGDTEGYGSVNCNGITFTRVAYVNGLKHNLISISQLCDANFEMENLNKVKVKELRSDNGTEFRNHKLEEFYDEKGISQNFSSLCTPEQNGVAEKRNRTLIEVAKTMLNSAQLLKQFWGEAVNTACYTQNRDQLGKFNEKVDDGFFLGYSLVAKAFRVFNIRRQEMEETIHVTFSEDDEAISQSSTEGDAINFNEN